MMSLASSDENASSASDKGLREFLCMKARYIPDSLVT